MRKQRHVGEIVYKGLLSPRIVGAVAAAGLTAWTCPRPGRSQVARGSPGVTPALAATTGTRGCGCANMPSARPSR